MTTKTFKDELGTNWTRKENGIEHSSYPVAASSWIELRDDVIGRAYKDGTWKARESFIKWDEARAAWAALMLAPEPAKPAPEPAKPAPEPDKPAPEPAKPAPEPAKPERSETFVDIDGDTWRRHEAGIDWNTVPGTWIEKHDGAWGRAYAFGTFKPFAPGGSAQRNVNAAWAALMPAPESVAQVLDACRILMGDPLPAKGTAKAESKQVTPVLNSRCQYSWCGDPLSDKAPTPDEVQKVTSLCPDHHWSFKCSPDRIDIARIYREMADLGVSRKQVVIEVQPRGQRSIRVAVHSKVS